MIADQYNTDRGFRKRRAPQRSEDNTTQSKPKKDTDRSNQHTGTQPGHRKRRAKTTLRNNHSEFSTITRSANPHNKTATKTNRFVGGRTNPPAQAQHFGRGARTRKRRALRKRKRPAPKPQKKMVGPGFYMIFTLTLAKDISDIILDFTVFLSIISIFTTATIIFTLFIYYIYSGVSFGTRKIAMHIAFFTIESLSAMPMIGFIAALVPGTTLSLVMTRILTNNELLAGVVKKTSKK